MILDKPLPWGEVHGKMSLTPQQAQKMLGYTMKPGAIGVVFAKRNGKQIVRSLVIPEIIAKTKLSQHAENRFKILGKLVKEHFADLIIPIWHPLSISTKYKWGGHALFCDINCENIGFPPDWNKLIISKGSLNPPQFCAEYCPPMKIIIITMAKNSWHSIRENLAEPRIAILHKKELKLYHPIIPILSDFGTRKLYIKLPFQQEEHWERKGFLTLMYIKQDNNYSDSTAQLTQECPYYKVICNISKTRPSICNHAKILSRIPTRFLDHQLNSAIIKEICSTERSE